MCIRTQHTQRAVGALFPNTPNPDLTRSIVVALQALIGPQTRSSHGGAVLSLYLSCGNIPTGRQIGGQGGQITRSWYSLIPGQKDIGEGKAQSLVPHSPPDIAIELGLLIVLAREQRVVSDVVNRPVVTEIQEVPFGLKPVSQEQ